MTERGLGNSDHIAHPVLAPSKVKQLCLSGESWPKTRNSKDVQKCVKRYTIHIIDHCNQIHI